MSKPAQATPRSPALRVLVLDDEDAVADVVRSALTSQGYAVECFRNPIEAMRHLEKESFDALLVDLRMPGVDGWAVLDWLPTLANPPMALVMSAFADIPSATEAMRRGAVDFIEKPFKVADLVSRVQRALEGAKSRRRIATQGPIAVSGRMREVFQLAERVAKTPSSSALIVGESGVGKEIVATHIHESSDRRARPFVRVNLAAIPEQMVESELFGNTRGAFTDAKRERAGLLASADGGTLLLDEITEFRPDLQPKLLRALEERRYFPLGSDRERAIDVRLLAATNRDPHEAIAAGRLRRDLYYRISTVVIEVPPLRDRDEDLMPLAEHFLLWFSAEFGRSIEGFSPDAVMAIYDHSWPGNVRELRNVVERAVILSEGNTITAKDLRIHISVSRPSMPEMKLDEMPMPLKLEGARNMAIEQVERRQIQRALDLASGNRTTAAALLGISRSTLWEKLKLYGL